MADPTRIFVSHSSKDNALTEQVRKLLAKSYEVLVDTKALEGGQPWPVQLHEMMADCHAAVVLLSANAVASDWVLKETTILTWRKSLEKDFKLFIAQFPEVTEKQLKRARYEPLQHRLIQGIKSTKAAAIVKSVRESLEADAVQPVVTLFDKLVQGLADILEELSEDVLKSVSQRLGAKAPPWRPGVAPMRALVTGIAGKVLQGQLGAYPGLPDLMNELRATKLPAESLRKVLALVAPHWVNAEAAGRLGGLVDEQPGGLRCRAAALNGMHVKRYTGLMYVRRAFPLKFEQQVHGATPALAGNVRDHYAKSICAFCQKLPAFEDMEDQEIVERLSEADPWLFVVISPADHKALADLQKLFPRVRFLVWQTGAALDDATLPEGVVRLDPAVDLAVENKGRNDYETSLNITA